MNINVLGAEWDISVRVLESASTGIRMFVPAESYGFRMVQDPIDPSITDSDYVGDGRIRADSHWKNQLRGASSPVTR